MPIIEWQTLTPLVSAQIVQDVDILNRFGESDSELNYLYTLRTEINKQIRKETAKRKSVS